MSTRGLSWRRLGQVLAGLAIGAICLVMWSSSSASALDAPSAPTPPPSLSDRIDGLTGAVIAPVDQLLAPLGIELAPVVDPMTDGVVTPALDATQAIVTGVVSSPGAVTPALPAVPAAPTLPAGPGPLVEGVTGAPAAPPPAPTADPSAVGAAGRAEPTLAVDTPAEAGIHTTDGSDGAAFESTPAPGDAGSSSDPFLPAPADFLQAISGSLTSAGQGSTGLLLLAVLLGLATVATSPRVRRVALAGVLSPRAMAYAIVNPPG